MHVAGGFDVIGPPLADPELLGDPAAATCLVPRTPLWRARACPRLGGVSSVPSGPTTN